MVTRWWKIYFQNSGQEKVKFMPCISTQSFASLPSVAFEASAIPLSLKGIARTSTGMILGVPMFLLRAAAEVLRQMHSKPSPMISDHDFDPLIHNDSKDMQTLLKEVNKSMEGDSGRKRQDYLTGLEENLVAASSAVQNQGDAPQLPAPVMQLDSDEHGAQSSTTEFTESHDIPPSAIRQMLTISVMFLARSDRPRSLLSRLLGYMDRASSETSRGSRGSSPPEKDKGKAAVQNGLEYGDSLSEVHLCTCIFCLKERELKWQLFLLREQQKAMISSHSPAAEKCAQSQLLSPELQGTQYCSTLPLIRDSPDNSFCQRQYSIAPPPTAIGLQTASRSQSQLQKDPQNLSIHRLIAFITFRFMILLHYLYPWAKAFAEDVIAIEHRHRLRERLVNQTCVLLHWVWRVLIVGALGWILADPDTGRSEYGHNQPSKGIPGKEGARSGRDEGAVVVKRWIKKSVAEIIGGICEGVEGGVNVWCGTAEQ